LRTTRSSGCHKKLISLGYLTLAIILASNKFSQG
jgi:hypothetical protein